MPKLVENMRGQIRFWKASIVLFLDQRMKRNPKVTDRIQYIKDYQEGMQRMLQNPRWKKGVSPELEQNLKLMGPTLRMMDQLVRKNPDITMNELQEMAKNPQLQEPRIRTRPGPPMKGRKRF